MIYLRVRPGRAAAIALLQIKQLAWEFPGESQLTLLVPVPQRGVERRLQLGPFWTYDAEDERLLARLSEFGELVEEALR